MIFFSLRALYPFALWRAQKCRLLKDTFMDEGRPGHVFHPVLEAMINKLVWCCTLQSESGDTVPTVVTGASARVCRRGAGPRDRNISPAHTGICCSVSVAHDRVTDRKHKGTQARVGP